MDRGEALGYLTTETGLPALVQRAGLPVADVDGPGGWGPAITATFRALGVPRAGLQQASAPASLDGDAEALLRFHALDLLATLVAADVDVRMDGAGGRQRSQAFRPLFDGLRAEARQRVESLGYSLSGERLSLGRLTLDYLEPVAA